MLYETFIEKSIDFTHQELQDISELCEQLEADVLSGKSKDNYGHGFKTFGGMLLSKSEDDIKEGLWSLYTSARGVSDLHLSINGQKLYDELFARCKKLIERQL